MWESANADSHTSTEHHGNYANYWLLLHTTSTEAEFEPPEDMSEEAFTQSVLDVYGLTRETMDDASITTKLAMIERVKTTFSEGESMAIKASSLQRPARQPNTCSYQWRLSARSIAGIER